MSNVSSIAPNSINQNSIDINDNNQNNQSNENNGKSVGTASGSRRGSIENFSTPLNNPEVLVDTDQQPKVNETTTTSTTSDNKTHNNLETNEKNNTISHQDTCEEVFRLFNQESPDPKKIAPLLTTEKGKEILADALNMMHYARYFDYRQTLSFSIYANRLLEMINPTDLNQFFKDKPELKSKLLKSVATLQYRRLNFNLDFMFKNTEMFGQSGHELLGASTSPENTCEYKLITSLIAIHTSLSKAYYPLKVKEKLEHAKTEWNRNETEIQNNKNQLLSLNATSRKNTYQLITEKKFAFQYTDLTTKAEITSKIDAIAKLEESHKTLLSQIAMLTQENNSITEKIQYVSTRTQKEIAYLNIKQLIDRKINDDDVNRIVILCTEITNIVNDPVMKNYCDLPEPEFLYRKACEIFETNETQTRLKNDLVKS
ncbi:hypothetical protein [Paraburkholderia hayleyella]|uniref:hypothetical protein n=1 Tax=Paraburkholderia hayleyella TaxID=2152889 RepID=UPI0012923889|nr:hypothetical protein [Paraburkholderia hayleyella]